MPDELYTEPPERDGENKKAYLAGIREFIRASRGRADERRLAAMTPEKTGADRERYRRQLVRLLGYPLYGASRVPTGKAVRIEKVTRDAQSDIFRVTLEPVAGVPYYGLLFLPAGAGQVRPDGLPEGQGIPLAVAFHGGQGTPELAAGFYWNSSNYNGMIRSLTARGLAVFAPQHLLWSVDEYGVPFDRRALDTDLKQLGGGITAFELLAVKRSIDRLEEAGFGPFGTVGLSYGGMFALYTAAVDTRIAAAVSSCFVNDRYTYDWPDLSYKGQALSFMDAEVAALVAPRPLFIEAAEEDEVFSLPGACAAAERAGAFYAAAGAADRFRFRTFSSRHEFCADGQGPDFLARALTGDSGSTL